MTVPILRRLDALRSLTRRWSLSGDTIGVVPTMGALHDGHLSLVAAAKAACDRVIVTIFVNPKQFNNPADLANYPRTEDADARKLERFEVDALWVPDADQMYPARFATTVSVAGLTDVMEGAFRPGHFEGVATVVTKLFTQTSATDAFFGEKDYQQLLVVRRMATDLDLPVTVHGCPTIREIDGLAADLESPLRGAFDGAGNYSFGLNDQSVFTEVDLDKIKHTIGMNITLVTTAKTDDEARELLALLGMPFAATN